MAANNRMDADATSTDKFTGQVQNGTIAIVETDSSPNNEDFFKFSSKDSGSSTDEWFKTNGAAMLYIRAQIDGPCKVAVDKVV